MTECEVGVVASFNMFISDTGKITDVSKSVTNYVTQIEGTTI